MATGMKVGVLAAVMGILLQAAQPPEMADFFRAHDAYVKALERYKTKIDKADLASAVNQCERAADKVLASKTVSDRNKKHVVVSRLKMLSHVTPFDRSTYFPKLKAFSDRVVALFPASGHAQIAEEFVLEREIDVTDRVAFLDKIRQHDKNYPKGNGGAGLLMEYTYLRLRKDPKQASAYLDESLKLYPGDSSLIAYQTALNRMGTAVRLQGPDFDGKSLDTDLWKGKVVVVNFWTEPWPGGIVSHGMPEALLKTYALLKLKGVEFLGVTLTSVAEKNKRDYLKKHKIEWPQLALTDEDDIADLKEEWGVGEYALLFVIGKDGKLVSVETDTDDGVADILKTVDEELKK